MAQAYHHHLGDPQRSGLYSSLVIKDNGDICIRQGDVEKAQTSFKSLPEKHYWPRLLKVFEREGIAASMTDDAIALNW